MILCESECFTNISKATRFPIEIAIFMNFKRSSNVESDRNLNWHKEIILRLMAIGTKCSNENEILV